MAERDAFGREVGENPLSGLGWTAPADQPETAQHAATHALPTDMPRPVEAAAQPQLQRSIKVRRKSGGGGAGVVVGLVVLAIVGGVGVAAVTFIGDVVDDVSESVDSIDEGLPQGSDNTPVPVPEEPDAPEEPPTGVKPGSLLLRSNFSAALATLRSKGLGRVHSLRVAPERIDAQLLTSGGRLRNVQLRAGGALQEFSTSGPGFGHLPTVPFARINRSAPFRLTARAAGRLGKGADSIDYLVLSAPLGRQQWGAYFKGGAIFLADASGAITRRL